MSLFLHRAGMFAGYPGYLLNQYPGAAAAYSLRVLSSAFASSAVIRVRRSSDNAEADFKAAEITDGTLTTWTGANDGFVVTWYDQSGNARDATQATAGNQPQIVASGVLVTDPDTGSPAIKWDGENDFLRSATSGLSINTAYDMFMTYYASASEADGMLLGDSNGRYIGAIFDGSSFTFLANFGTVNFRKNGASESPSTRNDLHALYHTGATSLINVNGIIGTNAIPNLQPYSFVGGTAFKAICYGSIFVIYPTDQSANRTAIESNIATNYGITLP